MGDPVSVNRALTLFDMGFFVNRQLWERGHEAPLS